MNLERDFAAWADRRDPEALTRVFDGTAGRLLLLAAHLAGNGGTAEDLVQATFLAAMTGARSWDRRLPLWPWLAGILQNEARMHWRRQQRRREEGLEAAAGASAEGNDPARLAASEEAFAAVLRAIDALPLPYRQVLRLRLVHGLQQVEIARALEIPVGTVRAQVHRGLAQLREALPAGVAVLVGAWLSGEGALMAQVRARVLEQAVALHAAATAAAPMTLLLTGGWWTVNGKTVAVVAGGAVLLLCLGLLFGVPRGLARTEVAQDPERPIVARGDAPAAQPVTEPEDQAQQRTDTRAAEPVWPLVVTVRTHAGKRIAGANVQVWVASKGRMIWNERQGALGREEVSNGVTGADGTFRCALDQYRERSILFRCTNWVFVAAALPGADYRERVLELPRTTEPREFEQDVEMAQAVGICGRVVDGSGVPVAGAAVHVVDRDGRTEASYERCRPDGSFCIRAPEQLDRWPTQVGAVHPSHGCALASVPRPESMPAVGTTVDVGNLVIDGRDAIRGHVVLADQSALADFPLYIFAISPELAEDPVAIERSLSVPGKRPPRLGLRQGRMVQLTVEPTTDAAGSFTCAGLDPGAMYAVGVRDSAMRMGALVVARPGGETVRLVVDRQLLTLDVRGDRGEALLGAQLLVDGYDPTLKTPVLKERPGFPSTGQAVGNAPLFADARCGLLLLSSFGWTWRVAANDENAQGDAIRHDVIAGVYRAGRELVLRPASQFGSLRLTVVDEEGAPFARYGFYLHCLDRDVQRNYDRLVPPADGMYRELPAGRWRLKMSLGGDLHYFPFFQKTRGNQEQDLVIEDGRTTEVKIVTRPLGRVGFRLRTGVSLSEVKELKIQAERDGAELTWETILPENLARTNPSVSRIPLLLANQALPPGKHWFVITAKGYQPARCEAEIAIDRVSELDVELLRQ